MKEVYYALYDGLKPDDPKETSPAYPSIKTLKHALCEDALAHWKLSSSDPYSGKLNPETYFEPVLIVKVVGKFKPVINIKTSVSIKEL